MHNILMASSRISNMLLMRARSGARGNAATKMVVKLYWITAERGEWQISAELKWGTVQMT